MAAAMRDPGHRCHRCGLAQAGLWYPVRGHGIAYCGPCYAGLITGTVHLGEPVFPVPA